ncbi:hypothetical protein TNIN_113251 [Trichonephila inaurata madagascariensis]|uniref:Uncharacterized protein n=1 Tax=Trichonephila inaurata madagascariensis TaxID=2747483 RepID=A0A8X6YI47_9ARAC|nr:hypothetical protein TNIN_113251 [Trichonephila inaurata madagascariensis]
MPTLRVPKDSASTTYNTSHQPKAIIKSVGLATLISKWASHEIELETDFESPLATTAPHVTCKQDSIAQSPLCKLCDSMKNGHHSFGNT